MTDLTRKEIDRLWRISKETKDEDWVTHEEMGEILKKKHSKSKFSFFKKFF